MPTISWIIERLLVKPTEGTLTDVVITADWRCNGLETIDTNTYTGTCYGSCSFSAPSSNFTPYADLTEDQVLGWCWENGVDKTAIEENVAAQIAFAIDPPVISPPLPWAPPAPDPVPPMLPQIAPSLPV